MRYIDEYRDKELVENEARYLASLIQKPISVMEICGGQTHSLMKYGLLELLPKEIEFLHGPGCPVCVTPLELIDQALAIAEQPKVIFCSFGDMLRVPGSHKDLFSLKAEGADIRTVYSPLDALQLAEENPQREVVFFAIGFETTAPANAMAVYRAQQKGLNNFSLLSSHFLVPPAMEAILSSENHRVQGFLAAGHVCTVMGFEEYLPIAQRYRVPIVVTGFEPVDLMQGLILCIQQINNGTFEVQNQYARSVTRAGNPNAQEMISRIFERSHRKWRGIGSIPMSGLRLRPQYQFFDAVERFQVGHLQAAENPDCISGLIMQGQKRPSDCLQFGKRCRPESPLGAPMVSAEGVCAAYFRYPNNYGIS